MFSDLGSIAVGLKCSEINKLEYYDVVEAVTSIDLSVDMPPDLVSANE